MAKTKTPGRKSARAAEARTPKQAPGLTVSPPTGVSAPSRSAPSPATGSGTRRVPLTVPGAPTAEEILHQAATGRYNSGARYGQIIYAVGDDPLPSAEKAKVKMGLSKMKDSDMVTYIENHIEAMTGNTLYPTPSPAAPDLLLQFTTFRNALLAMEAARTTYENANAILAAQRTQMIDMMNRRAGYVQDASNGNKQAIVSSGLGVKAPPTPTTFLSAPLNLRIDLNGEAGLVKARWDAVTEARMYVLQCREDTETGDWQQIASTTRTTFTTNLDVGKTYRFRVAACGVPGQSNWSPPVTRGVA